MPNIAHLARTATGPICPSLLPRTHNRLQIAATTGVPQALVIALRKHLGEAHGIYIRLVVGELRANAEGRSGSRRLDPMELTLTKRLKPKEIRH